MSHPTDSLESKWGRAVGAAGPVTEALEGSLDMRNGTTCPHCGTEGWPSSLSRDGLFSPCGTAWYPATANASEVVTRQGAACGIIAGLRFQVAALEMAAAA